MTDEEPDTGAITVEPEPEPASPAGQRLSRRRRRFVIGIAVAAVVVLAALCAGAFGIVAAVHGARDRAGVAAENRQQRTTACLELEKRLNKLTPPGATTTPENRAAAVQSEDAALRIYIGEVTDQRTADAWRQMLDARTTYAEALAVQTTSKTPAFYVAPKAGGGQPVADELVGWSPSACAGSIRRLAVPDL